jgi:hypothetical protein
MGKAKSTWVCDVETFIKVWQQGQSIEGVQKELKAPNPQAVFLKAASFRKAGVPLKVFPKKTPATPKQTIDLESALKVFAKVQGTTVAKAKAEGEKVAKQIQADLEAKKAKKAATATATETA